MAQSQDGGGTTIVTGISAQKKPLNLLDAVSEIQQMCAIEKKMNEGDYIDKNFFTTKQAVDYFAVGARNALLHFFFTLIATPIAIAVLHNLIHLFGDRKMNFFDELYALILTFSVSIGFGIFLATLRECYLGVISKAMIKSLFSGLIFGEVVKVAVSAIIYALIYVSITPQTVYSFIQFLNNHFRTLMFRLHADYTAMYYWILKFRDVFPLATVFIVLSAFFMVGLPFIIIFVTSKFKKRLPEEL